MAETGNSEFLATKREKQQITVPFCWEEKPGRPKRDWSLNSAPPRPVPSSATTFAASVPFKWEEKPGTPLRQFTEEAVPTPLCAPLVYPASPSPGGYCKDQCKGNNPFVDDEEEEDDLINAADAQVSRYTRLQLFAEAVPVPLCASLVYPASPSPGGNCKDGCKRSNPFVGDEEGDGLIKADVTVSPFDTEKSESNEDTSEITGKCETWGSDSTSETGDDDSDSSGSETRKSVEDASVLELLFPLSSPEVSFLNEVWYREKANADSHLDPAMKNSKNQCKFVAKRGPTLGELIMLSRKLSRARHNPIPERKQGLRLVLRWQEFVRKRVHACGLFGSSINQSITLDAY